MFWIREAIIICGFANPAQHMPPQIAIHHNLVLLQSEIIYLENLVV